MEELLIINPAKRPSKRRRSNPSPAQKRARAAFAAAARARSKNPRKRRASAKRRRPATGYTVGSAPVRRRKMNPAKRRHVAARRRRNPLRIGGGSMKPMTLVGNALTGAIGAIAVNSVLAKLPLPAAAVTGKARYLTQAVGAIALGMLLQKIGPTRKYAAQMAEGSLTVTLHDAIKEVAAGAGMNLSGMGYYLPGVGVNRGPSASGRPSVQMSGMGKYLTGPGASPRGAVVPINRMSGLSVPRKGMGF